MMFDLINSVLLYGPKGSRWLFLGPVQTWCRGPFLTDALHGHWTEHDFVSSRVFSLPPYSKQNGGR